MLKHALGNAEHFAVVDVETTGLYNSDRIVEIAIVLVDRGGAIVDEWDTLVDPGRDVGPVHLHGISASMVSAAPTFSEVAGVVARRVDGAVLAAHNLSFDQRMLQNEFGRLPGTFMPGRGLCTLRLAGGKLADACERHGITNEWPHRALSDARACAGLLRSVLVGREVETRPGLAACAQAPTTCRTLRRDHFPSEPVSMPYLARLAASLHHHGESGPALAYLDMLDWVLADLVLSPEERVLLAELAADLGLSGQDVEAAHQRYYEELSVAAKRDGRVSEHERTLLNSVSAALGVAPSADLDAEASAVRSGVTLEPGMRVCFTGTVVDEWGERIERNQLEQRAAALGLVPVAGVSKRGCDVLIAADPESRSGKAGKARLAGVPIVQASEFLLAEAGATLNAV